MILPDSKTFLEMLKNKEQVIRTVLKDLDTCDKNTAAFTKLEDLYNEGGSVNTEKVLKAYAKSMRHMNEVNRRLLMILLIYISGDSYNSDTGKVLIKMGRGEEALKEMFKQKMGGK